jgi:UDP-GlcNAc:undecaprenyl-phosphate GlcNAc-1-phosphate transferase
MAAVSLWGASGLCAVIAILVYMYPDSFGTALVYIFAAGWLAALVMFLRTPSQD